MSQEYVNDPEQLRQNLRSLRLELYTPNIANADTNSNIYCNVVFNDGSLLSKLNQKLDKDDYNDAEKGSRDTYELPVPSTPSRCVGDIAEVYIRKSGEGDRGDQGWVLGSALLFANELDLPVLGSSRINQMLDNDDTVLNIIDWSSRALATSDISAANIPLKNARYQVAGPVLGQLSDTSAAVVYRVEREGDYRLTIATAASGRCVYDEVLRLTPTGTFRVHNLAPDTHYTFSFFQVRLGRDVPLPEGNGEFRTFPTEDEGASFRLAFGSCSRNKQDTAMPCWKRLESFAADPSRRYEKAEDGVRFFTHLGDTFYYYDDVAGEKPDNLAAAQAANLSSRKHLGFLAMARRLPSVAVWDDHDFGLNNLQSTDHPRKRESLQAFLEYWGNEPLDTERFGLTTLISYGNVDLYLLDGRYFRDEDRKVLFSKPLISEVIRSIKQRAAEVDANGRSTPRLVILASGSTWNNTNQTHPTDYAEESYGNRTFEAERKSFFEQLGAAMTKEPSSRRSISGLVFLSGDVHQNEIYQVELRPGGKEAPEFVCSPLGDNSALCPDGGEIVGERKWSIPSEGTNGHRGFATLDVDTRAEVPDGNWTIRVSYHDSSASRSTPPYYTVPYVLRDGQFTPS